MLSEHLVNFGPIKYARFIFLNLRGLAITFFLLLNHLIETVEILRRNILVVDHDVLVTQDQLGCGEVLGLLRVL